MVKYLTSQKIWKKFQTLNGIQTRMKHCRRVPRQSPKINATTLLCDNSEHGIVHNKKKLLLYYSYETNYKVLGNDDSFQTYKHIMRNQQTLFYFILCSSNELTSLFDYLYTCFYSIIKKHNIGHTYNTPKPRKAFFF